LPVRAAAAEEPLARQRTQLEALLQEVAQWRAARGEWQDRIARYQRTMAPLQHEFRAAWREWVLALDHASLQPGLSRAERQQLHELVRQAAAALLEGEGDAEIEAVAHRHSEEARSEPPAADTSQEPALDDWEQQAAAAAAQRAEWAAQRRRASAAKQRAQAQQAVTGSLRDVYRRLASVLHPDREPDAQQRERKTGLMQQANQAYAEEDLSALIELQRQAEEIEAGRQAPLDGPRLQHHVTRLQEQLEQLQSDTRRLEAWFREETGMPAGSGLQARKADRMISSQARMLREDLEQLRRQLRSLLDVDDLKAWLRAQR
jgi:hypothetical protein